MPDETSKVCDSFESLELLERPVISVPRSQREVLQACAALLYLLRRNT